MQDASLSTIDLAVIIGYFALTVIVGLYVSRVHENAEDYFLARRRMTWPFIGLSLLASNLSSTTFIGLAGEAYNTGIAVFNYEWMAAVVLTFYAVFLLPFVLRSQVYTMPEYLERRFDGRARMYFSALTLFLNIVVDTAGTLYAGALVVQMVYPQLSVFTIVATIAVISGIYTVAGGLIAVMVTDAIQAVMLLLGATIIAIAAYVKVGGWDMVTATIDPGMISLIRPVDDPGVPWPGLLTGVPLLGFYFWCTNQFMAQRVLAAKSIEHGRLGSLFAGLLKLPILFIMALPGTMALALYPELENADTVFPTLMFDLLPNGLLGLVLAGFLAAIMGTLTSTVNSASTLATMDFVRKLKPDLSSEQLVVIGRTVTTLFIILSVVWAPQIARFPSLFQYLQAILSYTIPPVVSMFLVGIFWKRATAQGAFYCLITGLAAGIILFMTNVVFETTHLHFLYVAPILFFISTMVLIIGSLQTGAPDESVTAPFTWTMDYYHAETAALRKKPWFRNYRKLATLLLIVTAVLVYTFR